MARKPRIQYEGAVYHVMNRGDRGGKVFKDRLDFELFLRATGDACERTGWRIHAYVLLPNHFHWLLETPEANLADGMKWFLGAYSQRFNARHGQRGHVFQGRYKAVVIDGRSGDYFETVSTYIHLNPARARLLRDAEKGLRQYEWSSYVDYVGRDRKRPAWLQTSRVLGNLDLRDNTAGRRRYARYMEERVDNLRRRKSRKEFDEQWKAIRYGWYVGDEPFKEELLKKVARTVEGKDRASYHGKAIKQHDEKEAERLVRKGLRALNLTESDLVKLPKGDEAKCVLAWLAHTYSMAGHRWIGQRLAMGGPSHISVNVGRVANTKASRLETLRDRVNRAIQRKKD